MINDPTENRNNDMFQATMTFYQNLDCLYNFDIGMKSSHNLKKNNGLKPHIKFHENSIEKLRE